MKNKKESTTPAVRSKYTAQFKDQALERAKRMTAALVRDALMMALWRRHMPKEVIVHSDRGRQYCSAAYQRLISKHQLI